MMLFSHSMSMAESASPGFYASMLFILDITMDGFVGMMTDEGFMISKCVFLFPMHEGRSVLDYVL